MKRVEKILRLSRGEWALMARAVALVWKAGVLLRLRRFPVVLRAFDAEAKRPVRGTAGVNAAAIWRLVDRAARYTMPGGNCLKKALAAKELMAAHRIPAQVVIGTTGAGEPFRAHAWVEAAGVSFGRETRVACEPLTALR